MANKQYTRCCVFFLLCFHFTTYAWIENQDHSIEQLAAETTGEYIVGIKTPHKVTDVADVLDVVPQAKEVILSRKVQSGFYETLVLTKENSFSPQEAEKNMHSDILWMDQNYEIKYDPRENTTIDFNDPLLSDQDHHDLMKNFAAWNSLRPSGKEVVVAVTDDGVEIDHEDLKNQIWSNGSIRGWDACEEVADPRPKYPSNSHGTHVAGIIAAGRNNYVGGIGTAPNVKVMPIRWYGPGCSWTAALVAKSYAWAVDNGAHIINTSYNVDGMANHPAYLAAIDYAYENDVIIFNSAGNNNRRSPVRAQIDKVLFVASTESRGNAADGRSRFSNYGYDIDIAAPGSDIMSTIPANNYRRSSGTSMAAPNAAAVAALIWSHFPHWTKEQVVARLYMTSDNIDALNNDFKLQLGSGRVNSHKALTLTPLPPTFDAILELLESNTLSSNASKLTLKTSRLFSKASILNQGSFRLQSSGADGVFGTMDDEFITLLAPEDYYIGTNTISFDLPDLRPGSYRFIASAFTLMDDFGQFLDGNGDGISGDDFVVNFRVQ